MELQKRKRSPEREDREEKDQRTKRATKEKEEEGGRVVVVPTEEEVDEFFAILRRMQVAVKYFEKSAGGGNGGWRGTWREALENTEEEEVVVVVEDHVGGNQDHDHEILDGGDRVESVNKKKRNEEISNGGLDLNAEPREEQDKRENSGGDRLIIIDGDDDLVNHCQPSIRVAARLRGCIKSTREATGLTGSSHCAGGRL
ncbi:hypothetical protein L484_019975 [Morus notabilis]|uniref:Uncharacterized protein n=1 Tax=Morus notabilis TaxID=981085 RepID=W9R7M6_9ROSA|nr:hypothetical protein L484_019975 [Morus notabilis]